MTNIFKYPSVIIPFTTADPALDPKDTDFVALSESDAVNEAKCEFYFFLSFVAISKDLDDPELLAGAPAGLQIVAPKWGDEQLLADVEVIDLALNGKPAGEAASSSGAPKL